MSTSVIQAFHRQHASAGRQQATVRSPARGLGAIWGAIAAWQVRRQTRKLLYGMPPRLLRDIGVDPAEVYDQYHGAIGELPGDRFRDLPVTRWGHSAEADAGQKAEPLVTSDGR